MVSFMLVGCNYPTGNVSSTTTKVVSTSLPTEPARLSPIAQLSGALPPSPTLLPTETVAPSGTPEASAIPPLEQIGVVILSGQEIGTIQKRKEKFGYTAHSYWLAPEVSEKVVLQIKDPQQRWGFNLENTSSPMYRFKADYRVG